ncbi:MAG TPA: hypothetical protein VD963_09920, partial [Phycisphaerales bacterium]|nr:hypothetical protein [Phycisphaerales bacterium]
MKLVCAAGISLALTPVATRGQEIPTDPGTLAQLLVKEVTVGLAFALAIGVLSAGVQAAAGL